MINPDGSVNRYRQKNSQDALQKRLLGQKDPRSTVGMFSRGKNIYNSGSHTAHSGTATPGKYGPKPTQQALIRRIRGK